MTMAPFPSLDLTPGERRLPRRMAVAGTVLAAALAVALPGTVAILAMIHHDGDPHPSLAVAALVTLAAVALGLAVVFGLVIRPARTLEAVVSRFVVAQDQLRARHRELEEALSEAHDARAMAELAEEKAREREGRLQDIVELSTDGFWEFDEDMCFRYESQPMPGLDVASIFGRPPGDGAALEPAARAAYDKLHHAIANRWSFRDLEFRTRGDAGDVVVSVSGVPVFDESGAWRGFRGAITDITDRKTAENALREAKDQAESASRTKSAFLAMISHEIRTPLTGVIGMTDLLLATSLDETQQDFARTAYESGLGLLNILNDILDLTRLEAGGLRIEAADCEVAVVINDVVRAMRPETQQKRIALTVTVSETVPRLIHIDAARLRQILFNLVANAIKFTQVGGVMVVVGFEPWTGGGTLRVTVTDTGIGISPDIQPRLFTRFMQVDSGLARRYGGVGLGLAICKELCELMGGQIGVTSAVGAGSTFWFAVPCQSSEPGAGPEPPSGPDEDGAPRGAMGGVPRILVADDNPVNRHVVATILRDAGYVVELASDGLEVADLAGSTWFDAILMDIHMPGLDGIGATAAIRRLPAPFSTVPIIALTADAMMGKREESLAAGMDEYVTKPFTAQALRDTVGRTLTSRAPVRSGAGAPAMEISR